MVECLEKSGQTRVDCKRRVFTGIGQIRQTRIYGNQKMMIDAKAMIADTNKAENDQSDHFDISVCRIV